MVVHVKLFGMGHEIQYSVSCMQDFFEFLRKLKNIGGKILHTREQYTSSGVWIDTCILNIALPTCDGCDKF